MPREEKNLSRDIMWFKEKLDALEAPELPSSLSGESLLARLDEPGRLEAHTGWQPTILSPDAAHSGKSARRAIRPVLPAAAALLLMAAFYVRGMLPAMMAKSAAPAENAPSTFAGGLDGGTASSQAQYAADTGEEEAVAMDSSMKREDPLTGGGEGGEANPENGQIQMQMGLDEASYEYALENVVLNITISDSAALTDLYATPDLLFVEADYVVVALLSPESYTDGEMPITVASVEVVFTIKGDASALTRVVYTGGCVSAREHLDNKALLRGKSADALSQDYGLSQEEIDSGYVYTNVGQRPTIRPRKEYLLFLVGEGDGYRIMESEYAILTVTDGQVTDHTGKSYGPAEKPMF